MPAFSIVIPAYNAERTLPDTVRSIRQQTDTDFEVIVVDDGSQDGTAALAERLLDGLDGRVHSQANRGLPGARNAGVELARGQWLAFIDSDDLWLPTYLERMRAQLESAGDVGVAYCDAYNYDEARRAIGRRSAFTPYRPAVVPEDRRELYLALLDENFFWVSTCVPRRVHDEVGGFDEALRASEDWNMWLRILADGSRRAAGTTACLGLYRRSGTQMSANLDRMLTGQRACMLSVLERADLDPELRAATEARAERTAQAVDAGDPRPPWRRVVSRVIGPTRRVKDFRLRAPREVRDAFPDLV